MTNKKPKDLAQLFALRHGEAAVLDPVEAPSIDETPLACITKPLDELCQRIASGGKPEYASVIFERAWVEKQEEDQKNASK